jgi:hypothetical protein
LVLVVRELTANPAQIVTPSIYNQFPTKSNNSKSFKYRITNTDTAMQLNIDFIMDSPPLSTAGITMVAAPLRTSSFTNNRAFSRRVYVFFIVTCFLDILGNNMT